MVEIVDLTDNPLSLKNGSYSGMAGLKDGILINGECWLVKYPKNISNLGGTGGASYSTAPLSEYIGSHVFQLLGYAAHETVLGERRNKLVVACKDFAVDGKMLLEIRTLKNHANEQMAEMFDKDFENTGSQHHVDLETLLLHLRHNPILSVIGGIEQRFWEQAIVDVLINNNDRNNGNWGVLRNFGDPNCSDALAPVFDNGGSFQTKSSESKIERQLANKELLVRSAVGIQTTYSKEEHVYSARKFLDLLETEQGLRKALLRVVPIIEERLPDIFAFIDSIPEEHTLRNGETVIVCSSARKSLYKAHLEIRLAELLKPACERAWDIDVAPTMLDALGLL